ncbi:MAG: ArsC family transcriptional regulator [Clostridia bacterium]|nr:ArsC family transcriptional regulator [Clostridia bacterium]
MIQIYMHKRNFDVQKAERFFKERGVSVQLVDMKKHKPSRREVQLFMQRLGVPKMFDTASALYQGHVVRFTSDVDAIVEKTMEEPQLLRSPIVRNGQMVTAGFCPEIWVRWNSN